MRCRKYKYCICIFCHNKCIRFNRRRGTAAELQGQLPWAYIPASAHPMRDQLPPDEELPPVPLPDYTAIDTHRKACKYLFKFHVL